MLIRSQNKAVLLNFSNWAAIYTVKDGDDFIISSLEGENKCTLGKYSTKAKVMKVLDMIQEAYADAKLNEILLPDVCKAANKSQQEKENTSIAKDIRNAFMKKMVFQMPEDSEVEV